MCGISEGVGGGIGAGESTNEKVELAQEEAHYEAKRAQVAHHKVAVEVGKEEGEDREGEDGSELEEEGDKPVCPFGLSVKPKGKHPTK